MTRDSRRAPRRDGHGGARRASLAVLCAVALALGLFFLAPVQAHASPGPAPAPSASSAPVATPTAAASAHIRDRQVFSIKVGRAGHSAAERAQHASEVLEHAVEDAASGDVRVTQAGDVAVVYVGDAPVIQLGPEDAAAEGDASVAVHAAVVAAHVTEALHAERSRSAIARTVFSASLLVFSALIVFLAIGKLGALVLRAREWVATRPASIPAVRIAGIDVLRPTALRSVALAGIDASRWVVRVGLVYLWLLFALSLFDVTRAYSERLTGFVLAPLSGFVSRVTATMPVLFIGAIATVVLLLALRVIGLFFDGVSRGEPTLSWLPNDLAAPTSLLLRIGLVVVAASVATPLVTGGEEGPLARASVIATGALALALVPVLASAAVGVTVLFGRQVKVGDFVEIGGRAGVVREVVLLGVTLEDAQGCTLRVPHLGTLLHPTRVLGAVPPVTVEVRVASSADVEQVTLLLSGAAAKVGTRARVELVQVDSDAAVYLVTVLSASASARSDVLAAATSELRRAGVPLGSTATHAAPRAPLPAIARAAGPTGTA